MVKQELDRQIDLHHIKRLKNKEEDKMFGQVFNAKTELDAQRHHDVLYVWLDFL